MADSGEKIDGLIIPVVVEADEKSPGIALHKLTKEFLSKLKDGYIDVPAKIDFGKANTKELTDELEEVQNDFAERWKAVAKKGFFADSDIISKEDKKELDDFINSFKKLQNITGKDKADKRKTAQWQKKQKGGKNGEKGSLKALSETIHKYEIEATREMAQLKAEVAETAKDTEKEIKKANKKKGASTSKKSTAKRKSGGRRGKKLTASDVQKMWEDRQAKKKETEEQAYQELINDQEQIDNDIKQKGIGINERKAIIAPMLDKLAIKKTAGAFHESNLYEHMEKRGLNASDWGGGHRSKFAEMQAKTEKESQDLAEVTYRQYNKGKEYANKKADEAIEKGHGNRRPKQYKQEDNRKALSDTILKNTALVGGQLMGGVEGVTADTFKDAVAQAIIDAMANSKFEDIAVVIKSAEDAIKTMTDNRFKSTGYIGVQKGDQPKGEGKNLAEWNSAMKDILQGFANLLSNKEFQSTWADIRTELTGIIKNIEDQEKANAEAIKNREKMPYKGKGLQGIFNSIKQGFEDLGNKLAGKQTRKERIQAEGKKLYAEKDKLADALVTAKGNLTNSNSYSELYGIIRNSLNPVVQEQKKDTAATETQTTLDKVENARDEKEYMQAVRESSREGAADTAEAQKNQQLIDETINNANTGTDSEAGKNEVVKAIREIDKDKKPGKKQELPKEFAEIIYQLGQILKTAPNSNGKTQTSPLNNLNDVMCPCQDILNRIAESAKNIDVNVGNIVQELLSLGAKLPNNLPALIEGETVKDQPIEKEPIIDKTNYEKLHNEKLNREIEKERNTAFVTGAVDKYRSERADKQKMYEELFEKVDMADNLKNIQNSIKTALEIPGAVDVGANAEKMSNMSREQLKKIRAQRITTFGLADVDQNPTATGDLSRVQRVKATYGWGKNQTNPFKDLKLSEGIEIDTQAITEALQNALQDNMFNAQTGGWFKNLIGPPTLYLGQDSLEKSRAEADAVNTIMAKMRDAAIDILQKIQNTQLDLQGMKESGKAVFKEDGTLDTEASDKSAITLFANLEEQKLALKGVLADVDMVNEVVENTGGNLTKILQQLGFAAPELADCNKIIKNINSGLDKNGKALKFQKRTAEILNYSFQLMGRSVGQMIKNWIAMMNPLSLIKRAFQDFASYDVKWQRTMNVIKYNLRRIVKPMMEWIAQQIVNIIGLVNALMKGIGKAFGKNWDLFDKSAASAEQMREELEAASNVTASFDELHDIGTESSNNPPMDLMGDIYTPQWNDIYQNIENFGKKIGDVLTGIKKFTEGWNFWTWLAVIGGALIGLKVLKWLIDLFGKGKNPLQSVADGLSFLEKAVGWAILIWAFTEFVKALKEFIDVVGHMKPEEVKQAMIALAEGIGILVGAIVGLEIITAVLEKFLKFDWKSLFGLASEVGALAYFVDVLTDFISTVGTMKEEDVAQALKALAIAFTELAIAIGVLEVVTALIQKFLGLNWGSLFGIATLVGAFALFTDAMAKFAEAIKGLTNDDVTNGLKLLGGAFLELVVAIGLLAAIASIIPITAVPVLAVFALVIAAVALLVLAMSEFVKALHDNGEDVKLFLEGIAIVLRAFGDVVVGILSTIGDFLIDLLSTIGDFIIDLLSTVGDFIIDLLRTISGTIIGIIIALLEGAANIISSTLEGIATIITSILNGIVETFRAIGDVIRDIIEGIAVAIATIVTAIADGIRNVLQPILDFVDSVIGKVTELATTIVHEIGETIRTIIETVGNVILGIIDSITNAIPNLLNAILNFIGGIGPAIENTADSIMRTITKVVNFTVSAIEYLVNLVVDGVNGIISAVNSVSQYVGINIPRVPKVTIQRFVPQYEVGTNYVPNDGLAYLHQGEAVIPKKYNQPYQPADNARLENAINQLNQQVAQIGNKVNEGIAVKGQFVQRGSDLVATVEKANNRMKNNILNNKVYAR